MTARQRIRNIIARRPVDRSGFWLGNPHPDTLPIYFSHFGVSSLEELHRLLGSDLTWITPQFYDSTFSRPGQREIFNVWKDKPTLGSPGPLAGCETLAECDRAFQWPGTDNLDFDETLAALNAAGDVYRASGFWSPFFHDVSDLFGMEELLIKMHTHPGLVEGVFERVCTTYLDANRRFYELAGDAMDGFFFGNDLGTQRGLLIAPESLERFVIPWVRRFAAQARDYGYQVILHSCGSVHSIVGRFIEEGVECLHPLQARAEKMDAMTLSRDFKGKIAFLGGIDTQELLVHGSPDDVRVAVRRVRQLLGPHVIISPSHEALLPNVPPDNVAAMAEEAVRL